MIVKLRPGDLQNNKYRLNILTECKANVRSIFEGIDIQVLLTHNIETSIPITSKTYINHDALRNVELNEWLIDKQFVPYETGNPPTLLFWLSDSRKKLIFIDKV
jgi:hypothetical protein